MARILVVDDNPTTRSFLRIALMSARHDVVLAANGWEALDHARRHRPDLIFMDLMMPIMDGETAAMILKQDPETADIPIVVLSAKAPEYVGASMRYFNHFLSKPCQLKTLLEIAASHSALVAA